MDKRKIEKLGFLAIGRGDYQEAINIFSRVIPREKDLRCFTGFGIAHFKLGDYRTARWAFYKALEIESENKEAINYIAEIEKYKEQVPVVRRQSLFRAGENYLEVFNNGNWNRFFIKGINIGLGLPGYFPGEYPVKKGTYLKWFEQITGIGINTIRIYTVHPPEFYEALYQFNESIKRLYLFQGIWTELPEKNNFYDKDYISEVKKNIKNAVDAIYGSANLPERPGYPHGKYNYDVSPFTIGFIFGREPEGCAVKGFNELMGRKTGDYKGSFLSILNGTPFEIWITEICDYLQGYEYDKYKKSHPVSVTNWPTLDPLNHPSESDKEEELLLFQGIKIRTDIDICEGYLAFNEDMESLDVSKIKGERGGGFFATYHTYPYYPDFIHYDYPEGDNPYLTYLRVLKNHHATQPVLTAEFGVPSSRDITHWHRDGWHHGGHDEARQGEINGLLMKAIYESGMAGGILFSWFDEWFKKNWLFSPYYIPVERKPFWFNLQDAEENYGLLAAYPGYPEKKVNLAGRREDWANAVVLYEKRRELMIYRFDDGFDEARRLKRLSVQHDEGFLYLLIETNGRIDFTKGNYIIGMDTGYSETGEFLFPLRTGLLSPIGLKFLIHIAGKEKSRILVSQSYDKYLNWTKGEIKPNTSDQGGWVTMQNETNKRRLSKDGKRFFPSYVFSMSNLRFGSLDRQSPFYNSLADIFFVDNIVELRIPWTLINFTDPSSKMVLWKDKDGVARKTAGVKIMVVSYKPEEGYLFAKSTGVENNITDTLPERLIPQDIKTYPWDEWDTPIYHTYLKKSYYKYGEILSNIPDMK